MSYNRESVIVSITSMVVGVLLLGYFLYEYMHLPSFSGWEYSFDGQISNHVNYKEYTYAPLFGALLLTLTGASYWVSSRLFWSMTQINLIVAFAALIYSLVIPNDHFFIINVITATAVMIFLLGTRRYKYSKNYRKLIGVSPKRIWVSIFLGLTGAAVLFVLENYLPIITRFIL